MEEDSSAGENKNKNTDSLLFWKTKCFGVGFGVLRGFLLGREGKVIPCRGAERRNGREPTVGSLVRVSC